VYVNSFGINYLSILGKEELKFTHKSFQKRHILVHNSGIIDLRYIELTGEDKKLIGKRLTIDKSEIHKLVKILNNIVEHIEKSI